MNRAGLTSKNTLKVIVSDSKRYVLHQSQKALKVSFNQGQCLNGAQLFWLWCKVKWLL